MNARKAVFIALAGAAAVAAVVALPWCHQDENGSTHSDKPRASHSARTESKRVVVSASGPTDTPSIRGAPRPDARPAVETTPARDEPRQAARTGSVPSGYEKLADALGLKPAKSTPATRLMREYSADELALMASVQRATGGGLPEAVSRIIELHREGADYEAMREEADRVLAGNLMARLAVMTWLRQQCERPAQVGAPRPKPDKSIRIGGRLRKRGEETQSPQEEGDDREGVSETF